MQKLIKLIWEAQITCICLRIVIVLFYFIISTYFLYIKNVLIFDVSIKPNQTQVYYHLFWCCYAILLGFCYVVSKATFIQIREKTSMANPLPSYVTYYPVILFVSAIIVCSILHIFIDRIGYLFYPLSFVILFYIGLMPDNIEKHFMTTIRKITGAPDPLDELVKIRGTNYPASYTNL
ncbi:MAG: hypothetical protein KKA19_08445 [Candidatus Margulisbacteria bacterium]|nr:hypothetical protein [Candidatus Margulisiibacteriota bacterium]